MKWNCCCYYCFCFWLKCWNTQTTPRKAIVGNSSNCSKCIQHDPAKPTVYPVYLDHRLLGGCRKSWETSTKDAQSPAASKKPTAAAKDTWPLTDQMQHRKGRDVILMASGQGWRRCDPIAFEGLQDVLPTLHPLPSCSKKDNLLCLLQTANHGPECNKDLNPCPGSWPCLSFHSIPEPWPYQSQSLLGWSLPLSDGNWNGLRQGCGGSVLKDHNLKSQVLSLASPGGSGNVPCLKRIEIEEMDQNRGRKISDVEWSHKHLGLKRYHCRHHHHHHHLEVV